MQSCPLKKLVLHVVCAFFALCRVQKNLYTQNEITTPNVLANARIYQISPWHYYMEYNGYIVSTAVLPAAGLDETSCNICLPIFILTFI